MFPTFTVRGILLLALFSASFLRAENYTHSLKKGETVSEISQFFTGKASLWRNPGVQVTNIKTGRTYPKNESQYEHLAIGDIVTVSDTLVPTRAISTNDQPLEKICAVFTTARCEARLLAINHLNPGQALPTSILVPTWFNQIQNLPQKPTPPVTPLANPLPQPRFDYAFWFKFLLWAFLFIALIALIVYLVISPKAHFAWLYRILPKQRSNRYTNWPYTLAKDLESRTDKTLFNHHIHIVPGPSYLNICISPHVREFIIEIINHVLREDPGYNNLHIQEIPSLQILVTEHPLKNPPP